MGTIHIVEVDGREAIGGALLAGRSLFILRDRRGAMITLQTTFVRCQDPTRVVIIYDRKLDTLFIRLDAFGGLHVAYYVADGVNALFDPGTYEVVGFMVEDWRRLFLKVHPGLRWVWRLHGVCLRVRRRIYEAVCQYVSGSRSH